MSTKQRKKIKQAPPKKKKQTLGESLATLRRVLRYLRRYWIHFIFSLLFAAAVVGLTLYIPIILGDAIDLIVEGNVNFTGMIPLLLRAAVCAILIGVLQWLLNTINNKITYDVIRDVRSEAFHHIQKLPLSYLDRSPIGDTVSRVIADVDQFADGLLLGFSQLFTGVLTILGTLIFMLTIDVSITAVVVVLTPLSLLVARYIATHTYQMFQDQSKLRGEQTSLIEEMIGNQKVVKAFSHEDEALKQFDDINTRLSKTALRATFYSSLVNPSTRFINSTVYAGVALTGALSAMGLGLVGSAMTVGKLTVFLNYANQYTKPFNEISGVVTELQNALACAARIFALIEQPVQSSDLDATVLQNVDGQVKASQVSFAYTPERPLIRDFSLSVRPGQRVAIVGPTGCGKTTVINLLMRFYDTDSGCISVDGYDIKTVTRNSLRASYGMVLQETWLKSGTVRENIIMGKPDATDDEVEAAARAAHAHHFIKRLPQGYDTVLGEDGGSLSQGQKQLLCVTRIMLSLPPMLILDEATSSIDTRTELKIRDAFAKMMQGRTSFIVAHRLSTIRDADMILVMKDGNVIEQGDHDSLLAQGGFYSTLYHSQFDSASD
ncbi:MAG: ABC transporter ATP-binding protein [Clostridia bacterium]|nr:ABC transporter ATP-binding protein [Clostridia bacterium]MBQ7339155.1 ABC transporter ATP-binding protein [Clostridia bacterium]